MVLRNQHTVAARMMLPKKSPKSMLPTVDTRTFCGLPSGDMAEARLALVARFIMKRRSRPSRLAAFCLSRTMRMTDGVRRKTAMSLVKKMATTPVRSDTDHTSPSAPNFCMLQRKAACGTRSRPVSSK